MKYLILLLFLLISCGKETTVEEEDYVEEPNLYYHMWSNSDCLMKDFDLSPFLEDSDADLYYKWNGKQCSPSAFEIIKENDYFYIRIDNNTPDCLPVGGANAYFDIKVDGDGLYVVARTDQGNASFECNFTK
jgi:hypothetical protein